MALFSRKKKTEVTETPAAIAAAAPVSKSQKPSGALQSFSAAGDLSHVLMQPRITEKATLVNGAGVYVFNVAMNSNKRDIARAVLQYYKVTPRMVRVVTIPAKSVRSTRTGARGVKQGGKKAYIYLKRGESITVA